MSPQRQIFLGKLMILGCLSCYAIAAVALKQAEAAEVEQGPDVCERTSAPHIFIGVDAACMNGCGMTSTDVKEARKKVVKKKDNLDGGQRVAGRDYHETNIIFGSNEDR